jgi:hypothetical protein
LQDEDMKKTQHPKPDGKTKYRRFLFSGTPEECRLLEEKAREAGLTEGEYLLRCADIFAGKVGEFDKWRERIREEAARCADAHAARIWPALRRHCKGKNYAPGLLALQHLRSEEGAAHAVSYARKSAEIAGDYLRQAAKTDGQGQGSLIEEARRLCSRLGVILAELENADLRLHETLNERLAQFCHPDA